MILYKYTQYYTVMYHNFDIWVPLPVLDRGLQHSKYKILSTPDPSIGNYANILLICPMDAAVEIPWSLEVLKALTYLESQSVTRHVPLRMSGRSVHFVVSKCYPLVDGFNDYIFVLFVHDLRGIVAKRYIHAPSETYFFGEWCFGFGTANNLVNDSFIYKTN